MKLSDKLNLKKFDKLLVANRGEIACRIFSACKNLGIKTVAVYSDADAKAMHVRAADEAVHIGAGPPAESYLNVEKLIAAAKKTGAQAIHPGYGFLSEREHFAQAVLDAGLVWIGPTPNVINLMGNKVAAKLAAEKANVPTLPWAQLADGWTAKDLSAAAKKVGYPLLLKAAAGGGGRGMRLVQAEAELSEKAESAMGEAKGAFGSGEIFLERYCPIARHLEVQLMGDSKGNVKVFGERDCSAQRRHQKVIEEAPAGNISQKTRDTLWTSAQNLAKSVGYVNAGTCEFLMDDKENVYFLEMNTRLQVEHPVSELIFGVDLPVLQLKIAQGEAMPADVLKSEFRGHAMEVRIYAEDPSKGYVPCPGKITDFHFPLVAGTRLDTGYETGAEVPIFYDAMLAKVISWGMNREEARAKLLQTLEQSNVSGVAWNGKFLIDLLKDQKFIESKVYTKYLEEKFAGWKGKVRTERESTQEQDMAKSNAPISPWFFFGDKNAVLGKSGKSSASHRDDVDTAGVIAGPLNSEYPGKVLKVNVKAGDTVEAGAVVIVCESMKMEFNYSAPAKAKIKAVHVKPAQIIQSNTLMVDWEPA